MQLEEGCQAVFDHEVVLVDAPAEEGYSLKEQRVAIRAMKGGELLRGAVVPEGANEFSEVVLVGGGQGLLQVLDGGGR